MDTDVPDVRGNRARDRKAQPENNSKLVRGHIKWQFVGM